MNRLSRIILGLLVLVPLCPAKLINEIVVVIYHEMGTVAILASDVRPGLDGRMQTLREVVLNKLMELDALYHKIIVTSEQAERYIENIQKQNRLSKRAVEDLFREAGYSYAQALEYLRARQMIEQVVEFRVKSDKRMIISREQAQERYQQNPPQSEAVYTLAIAFVADDVRGSTPIDTYIKNINLDKDIPFDEPFDLKESEIADDRKIVTTCQPGDIVFTEPVEGGIEITRLIAKKAAAVVPFDDCFQEIVTKMRQERLKQVFDDYYKLLIAQATFRFTHKEDVSILESSEMI